MASLLDTLKKAQREGKAKSFEQVRQDLQKNPLKPAESKEPTVVEAMDAAAEQVPSFTPPPSAISAQLPDVNKVKERTEDRKQISTITSAPKLQKPEDFNSVFSRINKLTSNLPKEQKAAIEARKAKILDVKEKAEKEFNETRNTNQWLQIAETLGQALVQLGAGAYGLKHNVDVSGLQFNKTDWSKNIDQATKDLDRKLAGAVGEERAIEREERSLEQSEKEKVDFTKKAILRDYITRQQAYNQQVLQALRS